MGENDFERKGGGVSDLLTVGHASDWIDKGEYFEDSCGRVLFKRCPFSHLIDGEPNWGPEESPKTVPLAPE